MLVSDAQRSWAGPGETLAKVAEWMRLCERNYVMIRFMAKTSITVEYDTLMDLHMVRIKLSKQAGHEVTLNDALVRLISDWEGG